MDSMMNGTVSNNSDKIVDNLTAFYFQVIVWLGMTTAMSVFGIVSNIVNIIVFSRQLRTSSEASNASLLCLSVSDFCTVVTMLWLCFTFGFVIKEPNNLPWNAWDLMYIGAAWPNYMFAQITRTVTAYVALERCICVVYPFGVKRLITPRRTYSIVTLLFIIGVCSQLPIFTHQKLKLVKDPEQNNRTILKLVSHSNWQPVVYTMLWTNSILFSIGSVFIVVVCTIITATRVSMSSEWRKSLNTVTVTAEDKRGIQRKHESDKVTTDDDNNTVVGESKIDEEKKKSSDIKINKPPNKMNKEKRLIRMIIVISIIFFLCYFPDMVFVIASFHFQDVRILGKYHNLSMTIYCFTFLMETVNSSINVFVYYRMSSRYRADMRRLFGMEEK